MKKMKKSSIIIENPKKGKLPMAIGIIMIIVGLLGICGQETMCFLSFILGVIIFVIGMITHWFYN